MNYYIKFTIFLAVPATFPELLKDYALQGYRVIALAHRKLDSKLSWHHSQKVKR